MCSSLHSSYTELRALIYGEFPSLPTENQQSPFIWVIHSFVLLLLSFNSVPHKSQESSVNRHPKKQGAFVIFLFPMFACWKKVWFSLFPDNLLTNLNTFGIYLLLSQRKFAQTSPCDHKNQYYASTSLYKTLFHS